MTDSPSRAETPNVEEAPWTIEECDVELETCRLILEGVSRASRSLIYVRINRVLDRRIMLRRCADKGIDVGPSARV